MPVRLSWGLHWGCLKWAVDFAGGNFAQKMVNQSWLNPSCIRSVVDLDLIAGKGGFGEVCACQTRATGKMWEVLVSLFFCTLYVYLLFFSLNVNVSSPCCSVGMLARSWRRRGSRRGRGRRWWSRRSRSCRRSTLASWSTSPMPSRWRTPSVLVRLSHFLVMLMCYEIVVKFQFRKWLAVKILTEGWKGLIWAAVVNIQIACRRQIVVVRG